MADTDHDEQLVRASLSGDYAAATAALEAGASIQYAPNGEPSLWLAAYAGHSNIVELLISRGARIDDDVTTPDKVTPLWISCQEGKIAVVRLLLDGGASVDKSRDDGCTPLQIACRCGYADVAAVLLDSGADVNLQCSRGFTPLFLAARNGHAAALKVCLERGADVRPVDSGPSALWAACQHNHEGCVVALLEGGAEVDQTNRSNRLNYVTGITPLSVAAFLGHPGIVTLLLAHGADVCHIDSHGQTPLANACSFNDFEPPLFEPSAERDAAIAKALLLHGAAATLECRDDSGHSAHDVVLKRGAEELVKLFEAFLTSHYTIRFRLHVVGKRTRRRSSHPFSPRHRIAGDPHLLRYLVSFLVGERKWERD